MSDDALRPCRQCDHWRSRRTPAADCLPAQDRWVPAEWARAPDVPRDCWHFAAGGIGRDAAPSAADLVWRFSTPGWRNTERRAEPDRRAQQTAERRPSEDRRRGPRRAADRSFGS